MSLYPTNVHRFVYRMPQDWTAAMPNKPAANFKTVVHRESAVEWREYPRISPGVYLAYCAVSKFHFDKSIGRWVCFLRWDVLREDGTLVTRVPLWWNLGNGNKPRASRRGKYLREWVRANGGPPLRADRLSPAVFRNRMARVEIGDTDPQKSPVPYSVVRKILAWETGSAPGHSVNESQSQGQHWNRSAATRSYRK